MIFIEWRDDVLFLAKRLWSVRMALIGVVWASAGSAWLLLPAEWKPELSEPVRWVLAVIGVVLAASPGIAALVYQPKLQAKVEDRRAGGVTP